MRAFMTELPPKITLHAVVKTVLEFEATAEWQASVQGDVQGDWGQHRGCAVRGLHCPQDLGAERARSLCPRRGG